MIDWDDLRYFKREEFACPHCGQNGFKLVTAKRLEAARSLAGVPFVITSGYRCHAHNALVSTTGPNGPHTTGVAVDIHIYYSKAATLVREALNAGFSGVGMRQHGALSNRMVHLDTMRRSSQAIWTY